MRFWDPPVIFQMLLNWPHMKSVELGGLASL